MVFQWIDPPKNSQNFVEKAHYPNATPLKISIRTHSIPAWYGHLVNSSPFHVYVVYGWKLFAHILIKFKGLSNTRSVPILRTMPPLWRNLAVSALADLETVCDFINTTDIVDNCVATIWHLFVSTPFLIAFLSEVNFENKSTIRFVKDHLFIKVS